jgi:Zn-dependent M32 family carboxypeptidase
MNTSYGLLNNNYNRFDLGGYSSGQFNYVQGNYAKTGNADITIITDDGDRVTISSEKSLEASYSTYSGLLRSGSSSVKAEGYEYMSKLSSSLSLSITGDLDKEEYEDILSAVKTIESLMEKPFTGSMDDLGKLANEFGGLDTLSSLDASIKVEESMSYEQVQAKVSELDESKGEGKKGRNDFAKLDHALDSILKSARKSGKSHGDVRGMMDNYLSGLLDMFSNKSEKNNDARKAGEEVKDMIMNRLDEKAETEATA